MKKLTQAVFDGAPDWVKSAAVNPSGDAWFHGVAKIELKIWLTRCESQRWGLPLSDWAEVDYIGQFDATNWQLSAIDREY